jgi:hypothetical protein
MVARAGTPDLKLAPLVTPYGMRALLCRSP